MTSILWRTSSTQESDSQAFEPDWALKWSSAGEDDLAETLISTEERQTRWLPNYRFHHLFEDRVKGMGRRRANRHLALDYGDWAVTYAELADRANRLASYLQIIGVRPGDRVALLMDKSVWAPSAVLALSKLGAAYVPVDASFPEDRIRFIFEDSNVSLALTVEFYADTLPECDIPVLSLDTMEAAIDSVDRYQWIDAKDASKPVDPDPICYIIYTSGTTGKPKGVPTRHSSIYNFVDVAAQYYGYRTTDRVYQGMTVAFDFSVEELWVPLIAGATLVPAPRGTQLVGEDLRDFLRHNHVSALCCVPTLLATLPADLPELRFLLVSGEACPADVIEPWLSPQRRVLNAYGPTETTVTATWSVVRPNEPITIGGPLPTYSIVVLDPDAARPVAPGAVGEICVAGIGLADGYLNRPEETKRAFVDDFIGLPNNPGGRIYRTGDLGRVNDNRCIEYLGRIDTQVKIRGYRIELDEIATAAREDPTVGSAVVDSFSPNGNAVELVAYLTPAKPGSVLDMQAINEALRDRLPSYMIPSFYEQLDELPLLASTKVNRKALPTPGTSRLVAFGDTPYVAPRSDLERRLSGELATVLGLDSLSVESDFFDELGADSLSLAAFATAIRSKLGIRRVSIKRLYQNPSIAQVALVIDPEHLSESEGSANANSDATVNTEPVEPASLVDESLLDSANEATRRSDQHMTTPHVASNVAYVATGLAQLLTFFVTSFVIAVVLTAGYRWIQSAEGLLDWYLRAVVSNAALFFGTSAALVGVKWLAVGRFTEEPIKLWSPGYYRFWLAKTAIRSNPFNLFVGTPAFNFFLRSLGARIGADAVLYGRRVICTDLVSVGDRALMRESAIWQGYVAQDGYIYPGRISIGNDALVGEATVLDIHTTIGDRSQVGHSSSLAEGQNVPSDSIYQGSPAVPSTTNFDRVAPLPIDRRRRRLYPISQLLSVMFVSGPIGVAASFVVVAISRTAWSLSPFSGWVGAVISLMVVSAAAYFGSLLGSYLITVTVPRVLNLFLVAETPHPLYGLQYRLARGVRTYSNNRLLNIIFGDSSMIVWYLSRVGYDLSRSTQTGSNFGVQQRHDSPFLCAFGRNTLVSDGLVMLNTDISATSFQLRQIDMPDDTYFGNRVHFPADARVGSNCLIATKAAIPIDGPVRNDVGILGSPAFEIPRSVARDQRFDHLKRPSVLESKLQQKLNSNLKTLGLYLLRAWTQLAMTTGVTLGVFALLAPGEKPGIVLVAVALTLSATLSIVLLAGTGILGEVASRSFKPLQPLYCSLYDRRFWKHEQFWKMNAMGFLQLFDGTPMKSILMRLQGAKIGSKAYFESASFPEPSLVTIGDNLTQNFGSGIQCHSLEDGTFKSDNVAVGDGCTLRVGAFVHYGTTIKDGAVVDTDSFLMKGTTVEARSRWLGNPARPIDSARRSSN